MLMIKTNGKTRIFCLTNLDHVFNDNSCDELNAVLKIIQRDKTAFSTKSIQLETQFSYSFVAYIVKRLLAKGIIRNCTKEKKIPQTISPNSFPVSNFLDVNTFYFQKINNIIFTPKERHIGYVLINIIDAVEDKEITLPELTHLFETKYPDKVPAWTETFNIKTIVNKMKGCKIIGFDPHKITYFLIEPEYADAPVNNNMEEMVVGAMSNDEVMEFTGGYGITADFDEPEDACLGQDF